MNKEQLEEYYDFTKEAIHAILREGCGNKVHDSVKLAAIGVAFHTIVNELYESNGNLEDANVAMLCYAESIVERVAAVRAEMNKEKN